MTVPKDHGLKRLWRAWLKFGHWLGNVMSWVWMPLFYYILFMPFALGVKWLMDPLRIRTGHRPSYWLPKELPRLDMTWAQSQGSVTQPNPSADSP